MNDKINVKAQKGTTLTVENRVSLDPSNPVPFQYGAGSSVFSYSANGKRYIPFLGPKDNMANELLEARLTSTTQNACINTIVESAIGEGLQVLDEKNPDKKFLDWIACINNDGDSINQLARECANGFFEQGNHFIEAVRGTLANTKFVKFYTHPLLFARIGKVEDGVAKTVILSKTLARNGFVPKAKCEKEINIYDPNALDDSTNWTKDETGELERTIIHFKNDVNGLDFYGLPPSIAGLRYQVLEGKAAQYNIDNFDNNMVLGGMLILKGSMTREEAEDQGREILMSYIGEGKTGRIAIISSEQGLDAVEFIPYETTKEGSFIELDKRIEEKIVAANGWDRRLAGLDRPAGLSNGDASLSSIYDIKNLVLLKPFRERLIAKAIKNMVKIWADYTGNKEVLNYKFDFKIVLPLSFYGQIDPSTFIQVDEARAAANKEPDTVNGKKYLAEVKGKTDVSNQPPTP